MFARSRRLSLSSWWIAAVGLWWGTPALAVERIGVSLDGFAESGEMNGEQWIESSRINESFDFSGAGLSGSAWLLWKFQDRIRFGPGLRIHGRYGFANSYDFGFLGDAFMTGDYSLPIFAGWDLTLGGRAGLSLLVPGGDLGDEISRLQAEGAGVWSVPRVGWVGAVSVGARRQIIDRLHLRLDFNGQIGQLFLFATDERVEELRFRKSWNTWTQRVSATLGLEVTL